MIVAARGPEQPQQPEQATQQQQERAQFWAAIRRLRRGCRRLALLAIAWLLTRQLGIAVRIQHKLTRSLVSRLNELERDKQQRD